MVSEFKKRGKRKLKKEELEKAKQREVEVEALKRKQKAGEDIQKKPEPETIDLSAQREQQISQIQGETRFKEAQEIVPGITGAEFGQQKREVFARERPVEKAALDFASATALGLAGGAGLGKTLTTGSKLAAKFSAARQAQSVSKISQAFGVSEKKITDAIAKKKLNAAISGAVKDINTKSFAKKAATIAGTVSGIDVLTDWYALDNVIGGQKFFMKDVLANLKAGTITQEEAIKAITKSRETREIAISKVRASAALNPLIWPMRKLILTGLEGDQEAIDLIEQQIEGFTTEPQSL